MINVTFNETAAPIRWCFSPVPTAQVCTGLKGAISSKHVSSETRFRSGFWVVQCFPLFHSSVLTVFLDHYPVVSMTWNWDQAYSDIAPFQVIELQNALHYIHTLNGWMTIINKSQNEAWSSLRQRRLPYISPLGTLTTISRQYGSNCLSKDNTRGLNQQPWGKLPHPTPHSPVDIIFLNR